MDIVKMTHFTLGKPGDCNSLRDVIFNMTLLP